MNRKIFENIRTTPKGDIEANWKKAKGFVPLDNEIIVYKPDKNHKYNRIKIGDGITTVENLEFVVDRDLVDEILEKISNLENVSENILEKIPELVTQSDWNIEDENDKGFIKNKPFYDIMVTMPSKEYTLNNPINLELTEQNSISADGIYFIKVSDDILTKNELIGGEFTISAIDNSESSIEIIEEETIDEPMLGILMGGGILSISNTENFFNLTGIDTTLTGTFFLCHDGAYVKSLKTASYKIRNIKILDDKFLRDDLQSEIFNENMRKASTSEILSIFNGGIL